MEWGLSEKTFAVCSAVPDEQTCELVASVFPYFRIAYLAE